MTDAAVGLGVLLRRIAAELDDAAMVCRRAEDLAAGLASEGAAPLDKLSPLQSLDELTQRLDGLSAVLNEAALQAPADWSLDLAALVAPVRLGDLAARLKGEQPAGGASGEAEFF